MINRTSSNPAVYWPNTANAFSRKQQTASSVDRAVATPVSNQNNTVNLSSNALVSASMRLPGGGWMNASVYKSDDFSENNPVLLVRGTDTNGKPYETEININDVNPRNASFAEMMALDGFFTAKGQPLEATRNAARAMSGDKGSYGALSKFDFLPPLQEMMDVQRFHGNLNGYTQYKGIVDTLLNFAAGR